MKKIFDLVLITINGQNFKCKCGSNVFKEYKNKIYICNCCGKIYEGE